MDVDEEVVDYNEQDEAHEDRSAANLNDDRAGSAPEADDQEVVLVDQASSTAHHHHDHPEAANNSVPVDGSQDGEENDDDEDAFEDVRPVNQAAPKGLKKKVAAVQAVAGGIRRK